jgi:YbbR domain-containing protein
MKKILTNNLGLKILSAIFAVILWLVVVRMENPEITKTISMIPVKVLNESVVTNMGQVYEIQEGSTATIVISGPRSIVESMTSADFKAEADLQEMTPYSAVPIVVTATKNVGQIEIKQKTQNMIVSVENMAEKMFHIAVTTEGVPAEGYAVGDATATPSTIKIQGAESLINKINSVKLEVDVDGASTDVEVNDVMPEIYDNNGELMDTTRMTFNYNSVSAVVEINKTKSVPLVFSVEGEPESGYSYTGISYDPQKITITGKDEDLARVSSIEVPGEETDITGLMDSVELSIDISNYLPEGVKLVNTTSIVIVKIDIEALEIRNFNLSDEVINWANGESGFAAALTGTPSTVVVRGLKEEVDNLTLEELMPTIDLAGLGEGVHTVAVSFTVPEGIELMGEVSAEVEIKEREDGQEQEAETSSSSETEESSRNTIQGR